MEGRWLLFSGKSSPHKFGQSGLRAQLTATYGVLSPTLTPEAKPKPVTLFSQLWRYKVALGTSAPGQSNKKLPSSQAATFGRPS